MLAPRAAPGAALLPRGPRPSPRRRRADLVPRGADGGERRGARYGLADLVALSVASTVGSGVFSLAGRVASQEAGPAVVLSLGIGAMGCLLSATAYAELASRVVAAGSVYAYAQAGQSWPTAVAGEWQSQETQTEQSRLPCLTSEPCRPLGWADLRWPWQHCASLWNTPGAVLPFQSTGLESSCVLTSAFPFYRHLGEGTKGKHGIDDIVSASDMGVRPAGVLRVVLG